MANKIQIRRGLKANLPALDVGEPALCTDTKEVFVGNSGGNVALINKEVMDSHLENYILQIPYGVASGSANTYTVTLNPPLTSYTEGVAVAVKINASNTGASTININGKGAKSIRDPRGDALTAGKLIAGSIYTLRYNGTNFILQGEGATGNATASDLLSGKTASTDAGEITGSMPNRTGHVTAQSRIVSGTTLRFRPQPGYYDGSTTNSVQYSDSNFIASNILKGKSIFGLSGSAEPKRLGFTRTTASINWGARNYGQAIVFDGKMWHMGGFDSNNNLPRNVWYTTNGTSWTQATSSAAWTGRYSFGLLNYDNKMWVFGGFTSSNELIDVWFTTNGSSWTQATSAAAWEKRHMFGYTVFDGKMWLTGGSTSGAVRDVWYSTNGSVWTQGAQPGWSAKRYHKMLVYDNKMWVIGGWDNQRDVWYTTNGSTWTRATATASWSARTGFSAEVFDNKMWVFGGSTYNDVWYSTDGSSWTKAYNNADWSPRSDVGSAVFGDKLWIMCGYDGTKNLSDVWYGEIQSDGIIF